MSSQPIISTSAIGLIITVSLLLGMGCLAGCPQYTVYQQELQGEAAFRKAEWTKKVLIEDAAAQKESAVLLAEAEVSRAYGVAEANEIIGVSLQENEEYLWYLWINGLHDGSSEVIYVPTESNLPILEANRMDWR